VPSTPSSTLVIAHRGASATRPPGNTVEAFRAARDQGADWVELDVRRTADFALAVHHDAELADGRRLVDVEAVDLPPEVPLLAAALEACDGMGVNVEIKNAPVDPDWDATRRIADETVHQLRGHDPSSLLVTCFELGTIDRVRALAPALRTGYLAFDLEDPARAVRAAAEHGHATLNPWDPYVTPELVRMANEAGLELHVWTVNDPTRMRELMDLGVAGIITDTPDVLRSLVDAHPTGAR
jgi:glycerophosphoryl diester phosphodiesterase